MELIQVDALDNSQLDDLVRLYQEHWWTKGRTLEETRRLVAHSDLLIGLCEPASGKLIAFARVLSDFTVKAIVFDVIVDGGARRNGLGQRLMRAILEHPQLAQVRHVELYCRAELKPFYERFGFTAELGDLDLMRLTRVKAT